MLDAGAHWRREANCGYRHVVTIGLGYPMDPLTLGDRGSRHHLLHKISCSMNVVRAICAAAAFEADGVGRLYGRKSGRIL